MIRLLDLPGVDAIETRLKLNRLTGVREDHELNAMIEAVIRGVFGLGSRYDYEWQYDNDNVDEDDDDDDITAWRKDGWDVTGPDGTEAMCVEVLDWAMEVITAGVGGRERLEIERDMWAKAKQADTPPDPRRQAKDSAFLKLGGRRNRGA